MFRDAISFYPLSAVFNRGASAERKGVGAHAVTLRPTVDAFAVKIEAL